MDVPQILQRIKMKYALYRGDTDIWWKQLTFTPFSGVYCILFERENSISSTCTLIFKLDNEIYTLSSSPMMKYQDRVVQQDKIPRFDTGKPCKLSFLVHFLYREYFIDLENSLDRKFYKYVYNLPFFVLRCVKLFKRFCCGEISALSSAIFSVAV